MKSELKYIKLKTEGVSDVRSIAKEFQISAEELIAFHNIHCQLFELLPQHLPKYVEYIYVPIDKYSARNNQLLQKPILNLPEILSEKNYGIKIRYLNKDLQFHYKIHIKSLSGTIEIAKEKTFKNNLAIEQSIEQLFEKAEQVLLPLKISVNSNGSLNKVLNQKEIYEKWKNDVLPKLQSYYQSDTSSELLEIFEKAFINLNNSKDLLNRNLFYKLYFLPIYQRYPNFMKTGTTQIYFPDNEKFVNYKINYDLKQEYSRGNKIALHLKGVEEENLSNLKNQKGKLDLVYKFQKDHHVLFSITGTISIFENDKEQITNFEMFELN